jgi:hypothetical protein
MLWRNKRIAPVLIRVKQPEFLKMAFVTERHSIKKSMGLRIAHCANIPAPCVASPFAGDPGLREQAR